MKLKLIGALFALTLAAPLLAAPANADEASTQAYTDVHKIMIDDMVGMKMTGDAHMDFAKTIPYHQGAIDMAEVELNYGKDSVLRKMAEEIIAAQRKEIEQRHGM